MPPQVTVSMFSLIVDISDTGAFLAAVLEVAFITEASKFEFVVGAEADFLFSAFAEAFFFPFEIRLQHSSCLH